MSNKTKEKPTVDETKESLKIKKKISKPKNFIKNNETIKVDLSKPKEEATEDITKIEIKEEVKAVDKEIPIEQIEKEEVKEEKIDTKPSIIQEITEEEIKEETQKVTKELKEAVRDEEVISKKLPENIEKLVSFMEDTGGNVEDYVRLNADYNKIDEDTLLREYYKNTKPHLNKEEVDFILEDNFSWDEEVDEERDIKKKKLAYKEEIAQARSFLEKTKSKYYDEIKLRPGVTQEQQKAMDFFNRYNKEQEIVAQRHEKFKASTNDLLSEKFKGFEFNIGDKRFRYGVSNPSEVAKQQSDLSEFVKRFLDEDGNVKDYVGYHKAIYAAGNSDTIAQHFYEQGKADAVKDVIAKSKNINNTTRTPASEGDIFISGFKVKAISGVDSSKLKIQRKNKN